MKLSNDIANFPDKMNNKKWANGNFLLKYRIWLFLNIIEKWIIGHWKWVIGIPLLISIMSFALIFIFKGYQWEWTGFGSHSEIEGQVEQKYLWDWMELLIIPIAFSILGFWFSSTQKRTELETAEQQRQNEQKIAEDRNREIALHTYFDKMTELLLKEELLNSAPDSVVRSLARARTINIIHSMNTNRKVALMRFLTETRLIQGPNPVIDLSGVDLRGVELEGMDFSGAILNGANLSNTNLIGTTFIGTQFKKANFNFAEIQGGEFENADFCEAELTDTTIRESRFENANLSKVDFSRARILSSFFKGANLSFTEAKELELHCVNFTQANLQLCKLSDVRLTSGRFYQATLLGACFHRWSVVDWTMVNQEPDWRKANFSGAMWFDSTFDTVNLTQAILDGIHIVNCSLSNTKLNEADFKRAEFEKVKFEGAELDAADLRYSDFRNEWITTAKSAKGVQF